MTLADLQHALRSVEPAAVLVSARVLENIIRQTQRNSALVWQTPHRKSLIVDRQTLFRNVDQEELALNPDVVLPQTVMLLASPESEELAGADKAALLRKYWRRLFHASIHQLLDDLWAEGKLTAAGIRERIERLGAVNFEEIRAVLVQDDYLPPEPDEHAVYVEFTAVFLELACFAPHLVPIYFPGLRDIDAVQKLLSEDVDAQALYQKTQLAGAGGSAERTTRNSEEAHEYYWRLMRGSNQAAQQGNGVRAAILRQRASRVAPPLRARTTRADAEKLLLNLVERLQKPLALSGPEIEEWRKHLPALLDKADQGSHPVEAALLYDLQKVCLDNEHEIYALDLVEWLLSGGKRPIKRALPSQRLVRVTRTLRAATPRLAMARLADDDRNQFAALLQAAVRHSEDQVRERFRPLLTSAFHDVGLNPTNPLESTAFCKVVEELIDRIIASGFVTFSDLRDTLSRSALKLPDLSDPQDFIRGDPLLRLDRRLGTLLDGVYRPSEFYLRWLERFTALNFGTPLGRLFTVFVTVPFLGAFLLLEMVSVGLHFLDLPDMDREFKFSGVAVLGLVLMGLLHSVSMRRAFYRCGAAAGRPLRAVFLDGPLWLVRHTSLREVLASWAFQFFYWYLFKPVVLWSIVAVFLPADYRTAGSLILVFLAAMFFINSRPGQALGEMVFETFIHFVHLLRAGFIPALVRFVIDLFKQIMHLGETVLFTVDEWLRFRGGDSGMAMTLRILLSLLWFPFSYLIRFNIVVLIEPCLNPLKFPVVSIATKLMAPFALAIQGSISDVCKPLLGGILSELVAWWITFWLPDVFGFIFWEMKENWSLYRANRRQVLSAVALGGHGETMRSLLQPGFHSGTIPKLYARLRHAEHQARHSGSFGSVRACQAALADVEKAVHLFVTREFCNLLAFTSAWQGPSPRVSGVSLATNQIRVELQLADYADQPMLLEFQNRAGSLVAGIGVAGWLDRLPTSRQIILQNALAVLFKLAGADQVRDLVPLEALDSRRFGEIPITWNQCVSCWHSSSGATEPALLLQDSVRLFPAPPPAADASSTAFVAVQP